MNRHKFIENKPKERKPFSACEKCGLVWKEDYKCCVAKSMPTKPSDSVPRNSFKRAPGAHNEIWDNAASVMDETVDDQPRPMEFDGWDDNQ